VDDADLGSRGEIRVVLPDAAREALGVEIGQIGQVGTVGAHRWQRSANPAFPADSDRMTTTDTDRAPATDGPALRAAGLGRRFGERWAVRDMSLEVRRGEVLGLLGPNGAGKTTTVRLLTALIEPSEGTAAVDGFDVVRDAEAVRGRVGILTETPGLYDKLSAVANLDFFGRLYGLPADVRATRIERFLRLFDLWERRDDVAGTFSKGMKQKLAIARALLHEPAVVFLDEPTAALDPEAAFVVRDAIEGLRRTGRTIVLATHNLDEADRLCDRIAFVRGGLLRVDSPARLRGELGRRLVIRLAGPLPAALPSALAAAAGRPEDALRSEPARDDGSVRIVIDTPEPEASAPAVVRAAVGGGGDVIEVHPERTSLEQIYFDVMGVHPGAGGEAV
jgi:ABC-2 type transport system ATP-binding protein